MTVTDTYMALNDTVRDKDLTNEELITFAKEKIKHVIPNTFIRLIAPRGYWIFNLRGKHYIGTFEGQTDKEKPLYQSKVLTLEIGVGLFKDTAFIQPLV